MSEDDEGLTLPNLYNIKNEIKNKTLEKEVNKMSHIKIYNFLLGFGQVFVSFFIFAFYMNDYSSCLRKVIYNIYYDKYQSNSKDKLLGEVNDYCYLQIMFLIILNFNLALPILFFVKGIIRFTCYGNYNLESVIKKCCCYLLCCFCQMKCLKISFILYFIESTISWICSLYYLLKLKKYYLIDYDLDESLDEILKKGYTISILNFLQLFLCPFLYYCLNFIDYFLKRTKIYMEYYKDLVKENKMEEAKKVRNLLGHIDSKDNGEAGIELTQTN